MGAALGFFDQKYRYRNTLSVQKNILQEALKFDYNPSYSDFLLFINSGEFELSNCSYVGCGSFSDVYRVRWRRKPIKHYDRVEEVPGDVVLKISKIQEKPEEGKKFFREVRESPLATNP
jgi:hypothetical protein